MYIVATSRNTVPINKKLKYLCRAVPFRFVRAFPFRACVRIDYNICVRTARVRTIMHVWSRPSIDHDNERVR